MPTLHGAGPKVLAHDVGGGAQPTEQGLPVGLAQIDRASLPAATFDGPEQRMARAVVFGVDERTDLAHEVARPGQFDLDHLGSHLAEQSGAERGGDARADIDHPQAFEGWSHESPRSRASNTSFIEPICSRSSSLPSAVAVLWVKWCAMKWKFQELRLPMNSKV